MTMHEAWEKFGAHMNIPADDILARASFYAGYVAGANEAYRAAAEVSNQAKFEFAEKILGEMKVPGGMPQ